MEVDDEIEEGVEVITGEDVKVGVACGELVELAVGEKDGVVVAVGMPGVVVPEGVKE